MSTTELIRKEISNCKKAGLEHRFQDAVQAADGAIAIITSPSNPASYLINRVTNEEKILNRLLYAVALGYKGMALLQLKEFESSVLILEESYRLFNERESTAYSSSSSMPLFDKVTKYLVQVCNILGRAPPLPPLIKFPRTPHLFRPTNSKAITDDDLVMSKDDSFFNLLSAIPHNINDPHHNATRISLEEKIDGANLGISLSLDGQILVQNRSHYISHGEHAQFSQLTAWTEMHSDAIKRILLDDGGDDGELDSDSSLSPPIPKRRVLYGEWLVARHSIQYERLPAYFIAFDVSENDQFVSRKRFHNIMRGSGIPVTPTLVDYPDLRGMTQGEIEGVLLDLLHTSSQFRTDGGTLEGIVIRIDQGDYMQHRCKLVDPEFTAGITEHWAKSKIEKQRVDVDFAWNYMERCYCHFVEEEVELESEVMNPRQRAVVSYTRADGEERVFSASCSVLSKEPSTPIEGTVVLPRNLCWLWPNEVLVSSTPKSKDQIQAMHDALNVGLVITLTKEEPLPSELFFEGCDNYFCPVPDGMYPTIQSMDNIGDAIVRTVAAGKNVLEHCGGGKGRAGTIAACLLLRFGRDGINARIEAESSSRGRYLRYREPFMSSEEAIKEVRRRRPGSLETCVQENFVREYAQYLWRVAAAADDEDESVDEAECEVFLENEQVGAAAKLCKGIKRRVPKYIILAGLPGSGKSALANHLTQGGDQNTNNEWVLASTDELGKKLACDVVGRVSAQVGQGRAGGIIIDACNISAPKRREWLNIMHRPNRDSTALVFFDLHKDICISRVRCRVDHPTIPFGRGDRIVNTFAKSMELPTPKESELFGQISVLRSNNDISALLASWGIVS